MRGSCGALRGRRGLAQREPWEVAINATEADVRGAGTPAVVPQERRYPLDLVSAPSTFRELYAEANRLRWDPARSFDWTPLDGLPPHATAALVWSHRAWIEYRGIAESEAALVRACLERDVPADAKWCLTARGSAKAVAAEACWTVAERLGGYVGDPGPTAAVQVLRNGVARRGLDAQVDPDAFFVAHFVLADTVALRCWEAARAAAAAHRAADALVGLLDAVVRDHARSVRFGWAWLEARLAPLAVDDTRRAVVAANVAGAIAEERAGFRDPAWLADRHRSDATDALVAAYDDTTAAPFGVVGTEVLGSVIETAITDVVTALAEHGIAVSDTTGGTP